MIDKKELIETYIRLFGSHYQATKLLNSSVKIDDEFISVFFDQVLDQYGEKLAIPEMILFGILKGKFIALRTKSIKKSSKI